MITGELREHKYWLALSNTCPEVPLLIITTGRSHINTKLYDGDYVYVLWDTGHFAGSINHRTTVDWPPQFRLNANTIFTPLSESKYQLLYKMLEQKINDHH